jgi:hypothetical protein
VLQLPSLIRTEEFDNGLVKTLKHCRSMRSWIHNWLKVMDSITNVSTKTLKHCRSMDSQLARDVRRANHKIMRTSSFR